MKHWAWYKLSAHSSLNRDLKMSWLRKWHQLMSNPLRTKVRLQKSKAVVIPSRCNLYEKRTYGAIQFQVLSWGKISSSICIWPQVTGFIYKIMHVELYPVHLCMQAGYYYSSPTGTIFWVVWHQWLTAWLNEWLTDTRQWGCIFCHEITHQLEKKRNPWRSRGIEISWKMRSERR